MALPTATPMATPTASPTATPIRLHTTRGSFWSRGVGLSAHDARNSCLESCSESLPVPALRKGHRPRQWFPEGVPGNTPYEGLWDERVPQPSKSGLLCLPRPAPSREEQ